MDRLAAVLPCCPTLQTGGLYRPYRCNALHRDLVVRCYTITGATPVMTPLRRNALRNSLCGVHLTVGNS